MRKELLVAILLIFGVGCATDKAQVTPEAPPTQVAQNSQITPAPPIDRYGDKALEFDPYEVDPSALPDMRDLPRPPRKAELVRKYTGVIKNKTRYDVSVPSANSGGTLIIPAKGFIEYVAWTRNFDLTVYRDGKPFYCLKISAHPGDYPYMCKNYDFMAEIVKAEPVSRGKPGKKRKRIKKTPQGDGGAEALG